MDEVAVKKCGDYNLDEIRMKVEQGFELLGGIGKFINKGEKVLLKPNSLTSGPVFTGVNTHPIFLKAVIQVIKKQTDKIYVGDSPAGNGPFSSASRKNGMLEAIKEEGVTLLDLQGEEYEISVKEHLVYKSFKVDPKIKEMDRIINLPRMKTHTLMLMTMCVKNMFGIIPGLRKIEYHVKSGQDRILFAKMLVDLYTSRPPDMNILDGIAAMEGNGPGSEGELVKFGVILMGQNGFAVDAAAATLGGVDPYSIYTNEVYRKYKLKRADIQYAVRGDRIEGVVHRIKLPAADLKSSVPPSLYGLAKDLISPKPVFIKEKCTGCLICVRHCPVTALSYHGKAKGIKCDYKKCIRCFVCHEICPEKAISVKKPLLGFIFKGGK